MLKKYLSKGIIDAVVMMTALTCGFNRTADGE